MLRSCRRRGLPFGFKHRGCKVVLFLGAAQLLCTSIIYYLMGFGSVEEAAVGSQHAAPEKPRFVVVKNYDLPNPNQKLEPVPDGVSKFAKSAYQRAKTQTCKQAIADIDKRQKAGLLYADQVLKGSCPSRNISNARFIGCFRDNINIPDLDGVKMSDFTHDNSPRRCIEHCFSLGLPYAGLQRGTACSCGSRFGRHGALPISRCDRPCPGNATLKCGGNLANSVYSTETGISINFVAPRQPTNGTKTVASTEPAKIAFILSLNGRSLRQVGRLLRVIYRREHYYFIHVDTRLQYLHSELEKMTRGVPNIYMAQGNQRFSTIWGGASLLTMLLSSYSYLLKRADWKWDFVINLSETDFPIRSVDELALFLGANIKTNFILTHIAKTDTYLSKQGMYFTFLECENRMWRLNDRTLPRGVRMFGASDWVTLTRDFVHYILKGTAQGDPLLTGLRTFFNYTLLPAESYFHTVLMNTKFCDQVANSNLRVVNWQRSRGCKCQQKAIVDWCGCSPNDLLEKDYRAMEQYAAGRSPSYFFARKFEESIDQRILNLIEFNLLRSLHENTPAVEKFWFNEFSLESDGPTSPNFVKRAPFYYAFAQMAMNSLKQSEHAGNLAECPKLERIDTILSVHDLTERGVVPGVIVEFSSDNHAFQVLVSESDERRERERKRLASLDTINNPELEKLFAQWGFRAANFEVGSEFDLKENVFRNFGSLLVTNQSSVCLAIHWEKVAKPGEIVLPSQSGTNATTPKPFATDLIVGITSPDGLETSCTASVRPADEVTCICGDSFKLTKPGVWSVFVRSAGAKNPSVLFGEPFLFVVLPAKNYAEQLSSNVALLSQAFWSIRDICLVMKSSSIIGSLSNQKQINYNCFMPSQASYFDNCSTKVWSSFSADVKSLPNFFR